MALKQFQENKDLVQILSIAGITAIIIIAVIVIFYSARGLFMSETTYDPIAELDLSTTKTGEIDEYLIGVVGIENLAGLNIPDDINQKSTTIIRRFLTITLPEAKRISYKKSSVKAEEKKYSYTVVADTGQNFHIVIEDIGNGNLKLAISDKNNEIFSHETKDYVTVKKDPRSLEKMLPKFFYGSDPAVSVTKNNNGGYDINVNSCNNESIKHYARELVNNWVEQNGYSADAFNFNVPIYCDGVSNER